MKIRFWILPAALAAVSAFAVETKTWTQNDSAEFEKGTLKGLALSSEGRLSLAPTWKELFDAAVPHLWCAVANGKGELFAGGADGKVLAIDAQGKGRTLATLEGGAVYALALGSKNEVYAAVSPEAKVYRIESDGKVSLFSTLKAGYVWALVPADGGGFFAATGNPGQIQKIAADGKATVFFDAGETHVRSLAKDSKGNLIAGTEPGGLVLRVGADGTGFVLYQTAKREVTAVIAGPDGAIYAAASGARTLTPAVTPATPAPAPPPPAAAPAAGGTLQVQVGGGARPQAVAPPSIGVASAPGNGEIYRIAADGEPRRIWSNSLLTVYALAFDKSGHLLAGTGNMGRIYRIDTDFTFTRLVDGEPQQVTAMVAGPAGSIVAVTANPAKVYQLGPTIEKTGSIESDLFDAAGFTYWGRLRSESELNGGGIKLEAHSGNLDRAEKNWSPWAVVDETKGGRVTAPPARFLGWRATLTASPDGRSPVLKLVEAAYQAKNVAPVLESLEVVPANYKFPTSSSSLSASSSLALPPIGQSRRPAASSATDTGTGAATLSFEKGTMGARWRAHDANGDTLEYKVEIRGTQEREWKLLKDDVKDARLNWDSTGLADGRYLLRVTASDKVDNYPGQGLSTQMESQEFVIDNTPPQIEGLAARIDGSHLRIQFKAVDALSTLQWAEYSVNGSEWVAARPTTQMTDSPSHDYDLQVDKPAGTEFTIAVKVADGNDNLAVRKVTLH
ncbi:hypothetical protein [uncultured Paludibaculum sp.]|uniref:hypothetical protein n=1 Tax=uncultured Paludibaculum sp. TaxID=1765020 RepID=UPI002AAB5331|nr:hypothetical protein [uncultured Paludibaculum sp.]